LKALPPQVGLSLFLPSFLPLSSSLVLVLRNNRCIILLEGEVRVSLTMARSAIRCCLLAFFLVYAAALAWPEEAGKVIECIKLPAEVGCIEFLDDRFCVFPKGSSTLVGYDIQLEKVAWRTDLLALPLDEGNGPFWSCFPLRSSILVHCSKGSRKQYSLVDSYTGKVTAASPAMMISGKCLLSAQRVLFENDSCIAFQNDNSVLVFRKSDMTVLECIEYRFPKTYGLVAGKSVFVLGDGIIRREYDLEGMKRVRESFTAPTLRGDILYAVEAGDLILALTRPTLTKDSDWNWDIAIFYHFDVQTFDLAGRQYDNLSGLVMSDADFFHTRWLAGPHLLFWRKATPGVQGDSKFHFYDPNLRTLSLLDVGFPCGTHGTDSGNAFFYIPQDNPDHLGAYDVVAGKKLWEFNVASSTANSLKAFGPVSVVGDYLIGSGLQWVRRMKINEGNALGK